MSGEIVGGQCQEKQTERDSVMNQLMEIGGIAREVSVLVYSIELKLLASMPLAEPEKETVETPAQPVAFVDELRVEMDDVASPLLKALDSLQRINREF